MDIYVAGISALCALQSCSTTSGFAPMWELHFESEASSGRSVFCILPVVVYLIHSVSIGHARTRHNALDAVVGRRAHRGPSCDRW